ncbi:class 1 fructose-bisphosphatase [Candidatus Palauibacter sp.]|uniref:class 1 fructose-bisphosphatase n=1 Tax=Candidatus Palauibacter sp. TaxID=3101350 RepID=UPI003B523BAF
MTGSIVTVEHFIAEQEREYPQATGALTDILLQISLAAKVISTAVNRAGLIDILGVSGSTNVHGEEVQKLDDYANDVLVSLLARCGSLSGMVSEEEEGFVRVPESRDPGPYIIAFDPLDGSSNIDVNISVGTIFSVYRKRSEGRKVRRRDLLQPGSEQVAAGYVLYGSSTMLVFTTGAGVHGFTLHPEIGEFLLSYRNLRIPSPGKNIYSINEAYFDKWTPGQQRLVERFRQPPRDAPSFSARYVGSMVADFHRTLLRGGIFMYPGTVAKPEGKLRLLYEVAPMAMICEHAGGRATDGRRRILDIEPEGLHHRVPTFLGAPDLVEMAGRYLAED